jgi:hypothetical protein
VFNATASRDAGSGAASETTIDNVFIPEPSRLVSGGAAAAVLGLLARRRDRARR